MNKSTKLLNLGEALRNTIPMDWKLQHNHKERDYAWSQTRFDIDIYRHNPKIGSKSALKSIYIYFKYNADNNTDERQLEEDRISMILDYLFLHLKTRVGWPNVIQLFKTFEGGKFMYLIRPYLSDVKEGMVTEIVSSYGNGDDLSTQLIQMALKIREKEKAMFDQLKKAETDKQKAEDAHKRLADRMDELRKVADELKREDPAKANKFMERLKKLLD